MQPLVSTATKLAQDIRFSLFGIAASLALFNTLLSWQVTQNANQILVNSLLWAGIIFLLWKRRDKLALSGSLLSSLLGILIIVVSLLKSISLFWFESIYLKVLPLVSMLGLGLLAAGLKGLKQYGRELIIILLLCIPESQLQQVIEDRFSITTLTAKFSTFVLWYLGFEVQRQGVVLSLPTGNVSVDVLCTGINAAILLFKLAIPFTFLFVTSWRRKVLLIASSIGIAFILSVIRVAFLAVIVSNRSLFDYWHGSAGNEIFSTAAIFIFGALCNFLMQPDEELEELSDAELTKLETSTSSELVGDHNLTEEEEQP